MLGGLIDISLQIDLFLIDLNNYVKYVFMKDLCILNLNVILHLGLVVNDFMHLKLTSNKLFYVFEHKIIILHNGSILL